MKLPGKITLGAIGIIIGILAGISTIINNSMQIVQRATASEVPDNVKISEVRTEGGRANIQYENIQQPKGAR